MKQVETIIREAIQAQVFPGAVIGVLKNGTSEIAAYGNFTYDPASSPVLPTTQYDIASVTKSIPTNTLILQLVDQGRLSLDDKVVTYIPELRNAHREAITIHHLLTYTIALDIPAGLSAISKERPDKLWETIFSAPLRAAPGTTYTYTNTPAILLGLIAERITGMRLDALAQQQFFTPLGMKNTTFFPTPTLVPPTEIDARGEVHGEPHDETAWALRKEEKVVGNAGLFSTATDLLLFLEMLFDGGGDYFSQAMVEKMYDNHLPHLGESVGLGWELHQPWFMGRYSAERTFGKTGFTGCALIADPQKKTALALLGNRTYPHRPINSNAINAVRRDLADTIFR